MSYHRRGRRALAGITSGAPGAPVALRALSGVTSGAPGAPVALRALSGAPDWYRAMSGLSSSPTWYRQMQGAMGSLGDDTLDAQAQWRADMLAGQKALIAAQKSWADGDRTQKWIALAATCSIPVLAAIRRALGIGNRRST